MMRRLFDIFFSAVALIICFPLMVCVAILIKLGSRGNIFFLQQRVGKDNKTFWVYKFRTMKENHSKQNKIDYVKSGDPRITKLGRILRNTTIDELPQFWNVLKGDMSVVGPRPLPVLEVKNLAKKIPDFNKRHKVKPGITGLVQVSDLRGSVEKLVHFKARWKMDLLYIKHQSLWLNIKIILQTIGGIYTRYHASVRNYSKMPKNVR
jgi:lipopolysaccharide/colanic/teichoic acid biosynthesis glycosyltransferase